MRIVDLTAEPEFQRQSTRCSPRTRAEQSVDKAVMRHSAGCPRRRDTAVCDYTKRFDEFDTHAGSDACAAKSRSDEYAAGADDELVGYLAQGRRKMFASFTRIRSRNRGNTTRATVFGSASGERRSAAPASIFPEERPPIRLRC